MAKAEFKTIDAEKREISKKANRELRAQKRVPAVLYGPEVKENLHFSVDELELERILRTQQTKLVELSFDNTVYKTLVKRVEFDPVTDRPVHVDFYVLSDNYKVTLRIPVTVTGNARGVVDSLTADVEGDDEAEGEEGAEGETPEGEEGAEGEGSEEEKTEE